MATLQSDVDSGDRLQFYSGSKDVAPGDGIGEHVADELEYSALAVIPNWRRVLSNFDDSGEFKYDRLTYRTVEHAFQATKIEQVHRHQSYKFAIESGSDLALGSGADARAQRGMIELTPTELAEWDAMSQQVMEDVTRAKFYQVQSAQHVLLATGDAQLWHIVPRGKPVRFEHLERIRVEIREALASPYITLNKMLVSNRPVTWRLAEMQDLELQAEFYQMSKATGDRVVLYATDPRHIHMLVTGYVDNDLWFVEVDHQMFDPTRLTDVLEIMQIDEFAEEQIPSSQMERAYELVMTMMQQFQISGIISNELYTALMLSRTHRNYHTVTFARISNTFVHYARAAKFPNGVISRDDVVRYIETGEL